MRGALWVATTAVAFAVLVAPAHAGVAGVQYRVHFQGSGTEDVTDHATATSDLTSHQTADWTLAPADVSVWLPRYSQPPTQAEAGTTDYHAPESRQAPGAGEPTIGEVKESGTFSWQDENGNTQTGSYSCSGPVGYDGDYTHRVTVTQGDTSIDLETDLSVLDVVPGSASFGPCAADTDHGPAEGYFLYAADQPQGQRLELGMVIPAQEIGDAIIGGPAQDYDNVEASHSSLACYFDGDCHVSFTLAGDYSLKKICEGVMNADGTGACATGSAPSTTPPSGTSGGGQGDSPGTKPTGSSPSHSPKGPPPPSRPTASPRHPRPCTNAQKVVTASVCGTTVSTGGLGTGGRLGIVIERRIRCRHHTGAHRARCRRWATVVHTKRPIRRRRMSFRFTGERHGRPLPAGPYRIVVWQIDRKGRASARRAVTIRLAPARP